MDAKIGSTLKAGIIGFGSIGRRHADNMIRLGLKDIFLYREQGRGNEFGFMEFSDFDEFMAQPIDFFLISNPTARHFGFLQKIIERNRNVLVEKPVVCTEREVDTIERLLPTCTGVGLVAYNLRFHPCVRRTDALLRSGVIGRPMYARFSVGQYLPDWHPGTDYSQSYSAKKEQGGGCALDLIHEIDLAIHLLGEPILPAHSLLAKVSNLVIDTEDTADFLYRTDTNVAVSVHLDYLYRGYKREFEIVGEEGTILCDLFRSRLLVTGSSEAKTLCDERFEFQRNDMYLDLMKYYIECVTTGAMTKPSIREGLISVKLITTK